MAAQPYNGMRQARLCAALTVAALAGCATVDTPPPAEPPLAVAPPPAAAVVEPPLPVVPPPVAPLPRPAARVPQPVTVLFEPAVEGYADVAAAIAAALPAEGFAVDLVALMAPEAALERRGVIVAVGLEAATLARARFADQPIVFCQVFNYQELLTAPRVWGVHVMPPLDLQLRAWKAAVPSLTRVGFILSGTHAALADEALQASASVGVEARHEISTSDRETLYLFKRLAADVDGLWLLPDNRILSPAVLRELLSYAAARDISVLVHNQALLDWGASLAANGTPEDVAHSVRAVLDAVVSGRTPSTMTSLSEVAIKFGSRATRSVDAPSSGWVLRAAD